MGVIEQLATRLGLNGYEFKRITENDAFFTSPEDDKAWVSYVDKPLTKDNLKRAFEYAGHVLFIVDEKLIPDVIESREATPDWLRVLHGVYMGRIYVWNGRVVYSVHFDWATGDVQESAPIQIDSLMFMTVDTWLKIFPGMYRIARFWDMAFWTDANAGRQQRQRTYDEYQRARQQQRDQQERQEYYRGGAGAWQEEKQQQPPKEKSAGRDWLKEFLNCGTLAAAKKHYRALALEFHPDRSGSDTTADMQAINTAWDKAQRMMA